MPALKVDGLSVIYGAITAVRNVSFTIQPGQMVAILGLNGAGKTSTLRAICGLVKAQTGSVVVAGRQIRGLAPHMIAHLGVRMVPEGRGVVGYLSVEDNLRLGLYLHPSGSARADLERIYSLFPVLHERRKQPAAALSGGEQQMLAIGRAMLGRPKVLLLDEPTLGLSAGVVRRLGDLLERLLDDGVALVMTDQKPTDLLRLCWRVYVMERGSITWQGERRELETGGTSLQELLGFVRKSAK
ncbi:MAG TPA: ABC transporter ATP-binding protein [Dehalococcoidia bacterium]|nr:ABC transporter ATP-binding protein [Dehalococcoidia bacterium]